MQNVFLGLGSLLHTPVLVVWLVGIVLAVMRWSRHPHVSLFAVLGLAVLGVQALFSGFVFPWLQVALMRSMLLRRVGLVLAIVQGLGALVRAIGWGLMLAAVFVDREPTSA